MYKVGFVNLPLRLLLFILPEQFMKTNIPDIFSAGDVTAFPLTIRGDERCNIGHWQMSKAQGKNTDIL